MDNQTSSSSLLPTVALSPSSATESNASNSPPLTRDSSPSPSISPTPALFACPPYGRSFSAASPSEYSTSSASTFSQPSITSRSSSASAALRQRGYVRPQGVPFAPSAGNRDSVLSLGSIAHLQYYFARTGLLDGKGGRLAKDDKTKPGTAKSSQDPHPKIYVPSELTSATDNDTDSPSEVGENDQDLEEPLMLPPTVSTYSHKVHFIPPPPDSATLRQDLITTILDAKKTLQDDSSPENENHGNGKLEAGQHNSNAQDENSAASSFSQSSGWYEIQGLHILDVVTLAIRAAKIYYTSHDKPQRLYSIKSERRIREELLAVLDVLKRMAGRNFAGGMRVDEMNIIKGWVNGIDSFIAEEQALEKQEILERESWSWLDGTWEGREKEREWSFLTSFNNTGDSLPEWANVDATNSKPTAFLQALQNGLTLVHLHNNILKKSKRQFGEIKTFHTDTAKPYRCAENLRYWIKAAEIRWEIKLKVNVSGVVNGKDDAWLDFDVAILQRSKAIREELTKEWQDSALGPPTAATHTGYSESGAVATNDSRRS